MKTSHFLAQLGWLSVFVMAWFLVLRMLPADILSWLIFAFFFAVALCASAVGYERKRP